MEIREGSIVICIAQEPGFYGKQVRIDIILEDGTLVCTKVSTGEGITLKSDQIIM